MGNAKFVLKEPKGDKETPIYLFFNFDNSRLKYSTGVKIHPKKWSFENQRARKSKEGYSEINDYLFQLATTAQSAYTNLRSSGETPTPEKIKDQLNQTYRKGKSLESKPKSFFAIYDDFVEAQKATKGRLTIKKYLTLKAHLKNFEKHQKQKISFDKLDLHFYERLRAYFTNELNFLNNTLDKYMTTLKTFLNWATERGYNEKVDYLKFKSQKEEADIIYLTRAELNALYELDLSQNSRLEKVRDVFCLGCFTGLRFSDIAQLKKEHIQGNKIHLNTIKTKERLTIPLVEQSKEILERYDYNLPHISNQKMNDYLKELGAKAEINDHILKTQYRGGEKVQTRKAKYELLTTHCARRTFVTLSLEMGMRPETVMAITGHKSYKTFKKYIKITDKVKETEMNEIWGNNGLKLANA